MALMVDSIEAAVISAGGLKSGGGCGGLDIVKEEDEEDFARSEEERGG